MFAVWMFAPMIEQQWGERRFLVYYLVCGLGAALVQELVWMLMLDNMSATYSAASLAHMAYFMNTIGASGAVFGILFAFGWLYPDVPMFIIFVPVPIRARTFVIIYALIELFAGLGSVAGISADHVAHFAHLGGFLFGWLLVLFWKKTNWCEPGELWNKIRTKLGGSHRPDSTKDDKFDGYHYQRRL
jgi:membrane associated rhomboid family serine protease